MKKIFIVKSWKILILVCAVIGLGALFAIAYTQLTRYFIDMVQTGKNIFVLQNGLLVVGFFAWSMICDYFTVIGKGKYTKCVMTELKRQLVYHVFQEDLEKLIQTSDSRFDPMAALITDIKMIEEAYLGNIFNILGSAFMLLFAFLALLRFHLILAAAVFTFLLLYSITPKTLQANYAQAREAEAGAYQKLLHKIANLFAGISVIKVFGIEDKAYKSFAQVNDLAENQRFYAQKKYSWLELYIGMAGLSIQFGMLFLCAGLAQTGRISLGTWMATGQMMMMLLGQANTLKRGIAQIRAVQPIVRKMDKYLKEIPLKPAEYNGLKLRGDIRLTGVNYAYAGSPAQALTNINICFQAGKKYAVIGRSGSGKSTLIKLINKQMQPQTGSIYIGRHSYADIKANDLYHNMAVIGQEVFLFDDTVENNITLYGSYDPEKIAGLLAKVQLTETVAKAGAGLQEKSERFSGGEKQRISIARALLRENKIILCDEIFSALDRSTTDKINQLLLGLDGVTVINITHDISRNVLAGYDQIILLEAGKVVYQGRYQAAVILEKML